jgi:hypothetical protein
MTITLGFAFCVFQYSGEYFLNSFHIAMTAISMNSMLKKSITVYTPAGCLVFFSVEGSVDTIALLQDAFAVIFQNFCNRAIRFSVTHFQLSDVSACSSHFQEVARTKTFVRSNRNQHQMAGPIDL